MLANQVNCNQNNTTKSNEFWREYGCIWMNYSNRFNPYLIKITIYI
jgi:hypothetical protein